jgi:2-oxoglutarate ferredoxin oxidoreductase subunit beta
MTDASATLTRKDFQSNQEVRWCPGCGDYAILSAMQSVLPELGIPKEKFAIISGIGCSSRFPYYMDTYGFHSIHGRAPAIATGLKMTRPDLEVWVVTGDGDALSIGGNHLIHMLRRNVGIKILLFNNRIYGLTKGQYSPTSEKGKRTKSSPVGSLADPFNPLSLALGSGATFVARSVDIFQTHLKDTLRRAAAHKGSAFVEILQNCNIFNDGTFSEVTSSEGRIENAVYLEHGKPVTFGRDSKKGIRLRGLELEVFDLEGSLGPEDCLVWDEDRDNPALAFLMSRLGSGHSPTPLGVFRCVDSIPYETAIVEQIQQVEDNMGRGNLEALMHSGDTWTVGSEDHAN